MRGIRTVHSNDTNTTLPQTDSTGHRTQRHKALCPLQNHNTANESQQNQMRQQPPPATPLRFSPLPLPWQAEPKQKSQHEKRQQKGKKKRKEKKR